MWSRDVLKASEVTAVSSHSRVQCIAQLSCWTTSDIRHTLMGIKVRADIRVGVLLRVFPCEYKETRHRSDRSDSVCDDAQTPVDEE